MPKQSSIKWRDDDQKELQRLNKNAKAKRDRLLKKKPELEEFIPELKKASDFETRKDFINYQKELKRFTQRGSEETTEYKGFSVPKYFKKQASIELSKENKRRAELRKAMSDEAGTNTKGNRIATEPVKLEKAKNVKALKERVRGIQKRNTDKVKIDLSAAYKENYFDALQKNLGEFADPIINLLKNKSGEEMAKLGKGNLKLSIDYTYSYGQREMRARDIYNEWSYLLGLDIDFDEIDIDELEE